MIIINIERGDPEFLGLLKGLPVLEYRNIREWHDVHPLLWDLTQEGLKP